MAGIIACVGNASLRLVGENPEPAITAKPVCTEVSAVEGKDGIHILVFGGVYQRGIGELGPKFLIPSQESGDPDSCFIADWHY